MDQGSFLFTIGNLSQATSMLLVFAAILFVFLLLLIVITVKVFRSGKDTDEEKDELLHADEDEEEETVSLSAADPFQSYKEKNRDEDDGEEGTTVLSGPEQNPDIRRIVEETQAAVDQAIASERSEAMNKAEQKKLKTPPRPRQDNTLDFAEVRRRLAEQEGYEEEAAPPDMSDYDISRDSVFAEADEDSMMAVEDSGEEPTSLIGTKPYQGKGVRIRDEEEDAGDGFLDDDLDDDTDDLDDDLNDEEYEDDVLSQPVYAEPVREVNSGSEKETLANEDFSSGDIPAEEAEETYASSEESSSGLYDEDQVTFGEQMSLDQFLAEQPAENPAPLQYETEPVKEKAPAAGKITVNPVNAVNIRTVNSVAPVNTINPEAGINDMQEVEDFLAENPVPKKQKKKLRKKDIPFENRFGSKEGEIKGARYFWYNSQDIEDLTRKEDMYFYCHYFEQPEKAVMALVTEMYDCGFVRTEEIQRIAFGVQFRSMGMKEILSAKENISFDKNKAVKTPDEKDRREISRKWCEYVDQFLGIVVFNAPEEVQEMIKKRLYAYGERDPEVLIYSPQ